MGGIMESRYITAWIIVGFGVLALYLLTQTWLVKWELIKITVEERRAHREAAVEAREDVYGREQAQLIIRSDRAAGRQLRAWSVFRAFSYVAVVMVTGWVALQVAATTPQVDGYPDKAALGSGWDEGWSNACAVIFNYSSDGTLYYQDRAYNRDWCLGLNQSEQFLDYSGELTASYIEGGTVEQYTAVGREIGARTALFTVFAAVPQLCAGNECIDAYTILDNVYVPQDSMGL